MKKQLEVLIKEIRKTYNIDNKSEVSISVDETKNIIDAKVMVDNKLIYRVVNDIPVSQKELDDTNEEYEKIKGRSV